MATVSSRTGPATAGPRHLAWVAALATCLALTSASGQEEGQGAVRADLQAGASIWWTLREQAGNGLRQAGSLDPAADLASGFNFRQGRLALRLQTWEKDLELLVRLRLEERTDILDFWVEWRPRPGLAWRAGQQKVPATDEVLRPDEELDFITRSTFGSRLGDLSLARTPYISSVMAVKSWDRDLGISMRGGWPAAMPRLRLLAMVGNGLGAGNYIGGNESSEFLFSNRPGDLYAGTRLEWTAVRADGRGPDRLRVGGHASVNRHHDATLDARGPVFDLDRRSWSLDAGATGPHGHRIGGFLGAGRLEDNWTGEPYRYAFRGWGAWWLWVPGRGPWELGARRDLFHGEFLPGGDPTVERHWTLGLTWTPSPHTRLQLNYMRKVTASVRDPDPEDDILFLNLQAGLEAVIHP